MSIGEIIALSFAEGIVTGAPTQTSLTSKNLFVFADDAAFETFKGSAGEDGDLYKNSTDGFIHYHDGDSWQVLNTNHHGFVEPATYVTIAFNDSPAGITVTPTVTSYDYYISGLKRTISSPKTHNIVEAEGLWYFYLDVNGDLASTQDSAITFDPDYAYIANAYWDDTNNTWILSTNEYHQWTWPLAVKSYAHTYMRTRYRSGLTPGNFTISTGAADSHAQFSVTSGEIQDEDLEHSITTQAFPASLPILYRTGVSGAWRIDALTNFAFKTFSGGSGRVAYNQFTGGAWQQTEVPNNDFVLVHGFGTNDRRYKPMIIQGQTTYTSLANARTGAVTEIANLITTGLPLEERVPLWTIIIQTSNAYGNSVKARIVTNDLGTNYIDWRNQQISPTSGTSDHGSLGGIGDDDHLQYWKTSGRLGDTILYFGDSSTDGSFRINMSGAMPVIEKRVAGNWTIFSYTIVQDTIVNINAAARVKGQIWYATDENKYYGDDGAALTALGGGGGGGPQVIWHNDGTYAWGEVTYYNQKAYSAYAGSAQKLYTILKVPASYQTGDDLVMKVDIASDVGSGNILLQATASLINSSSSNLGDTTNQHSSTNSAQAIAAANKKYEIELDLTSGGQINSVDPVAGDDIVVFFTRGTDTNTGYCYLIPSTLQINIG